MTTHKQVDDNVKFAVTDFLMDNTSNEDSRKLLGLLASDPDAEKVFRDLSLVWMLASSSTFSFNEDKELEGIHRRLKNHRYKYRTVIHKHWLGALGMVATLAVAFCLATILLIQNNRQLQRTYTAITAPYEISVPAGSLTTITLPDGSEATLNSGSRLTYPHDFGIFNRTLTLEGEAFFKVAKDADRPFSVQTRHLSVEVTGTTFNVETYDDDDRITVSLAEGSVLLKDIMGRSMSLRPSQQASYDKRTGKMSITKIDPDRVSSWRDGSISALGNNNGP